jgi:membrane protease YdiL (CAAX protease family)
MDKVQFNAIIFTVGFIACGMVWFGIRLSYGEFRIPDTYSLFFYLMLVPTAEEMFYRGVLQSYLKKKTDYKILGITLANVAVSVIFALSHVPVWGVMHSALVFIPSLVFGFMFDRTGKIIYPLIIHSVYNMNVFIV